MKHFQRLPAGFTLQSTGSTSFFSTPDHSVIEVGSIVRVKITAVSLQYNPLTMVFLSYFLIFSSNIFAFVEYQWPNGPGLSRSIKQERGYCHNGK